MTIKTNIEQTHTVIKNKSKHVEILFCSFQPSLVAILIHKIPKEINSNLHFFFF